MKPKIFALCVFFIIFVHGLNCESENILDEDDIPELIYLNKSVNPCDDFFEFTCGNFRNIHPRPKGDVATMDNFALLQEKLIKLASDMLSTAISEDEPDAIQKAKMAYLACMNTEFSDTINLSYPELRIIDDVDGMPLLDLFNEDIEFSWNDIGDLVAEYGVPLLFNLDVVNPLGITYSIYLSKDGGLQLPTFIRESEEISYEQVLEKSFEEYGKQDFILSSGRPMAFDVFLETIARRLRDQQNPLLNTRILLERLEEVKSFMRKMAQGGDLDGLPEDDLPAVSVTLEQLNNWTRTYFDDDINLDWVEYMRHTFKLSGVNITEKVQVTQTLGSQIYGTLNLVRKTDPAILKNFALLRIFLFLAPDSDYVMRKAFEDYYNSKKFIVYPRWQYCTRKLLDVSGYASLSFAVAHEYQKYYFDVNKLHQALNMIEDIQETFKDTLTNADWMDESSKEAALKKAENMLTLLAYPEFVADSELVDQFYENMRVCAWDNYGNSQKIRAFKQAYGFSQIKGKNRTFWNKSPFEANAYYNRPNNRMMFPVSMLNPVFFNGKISVLDYARIGSVIGHEMTHGFDMEGKNFNEEGVYKAWWSENTLEAFNNKTKCFVDQYDKYEIKEFDIKVDGTKSLNENLADNGGIRTAYAAFRRLLAKGFTPYRTDDFTTEQLFFVGLGTMWCNDASPGYMKSIVNYPPSKIRVNGAVSNLKEFSEAFNCPAGSNMNPDKKCILW